MLSKIKSVKLIKQFLTITCLISLMVLMTAGNAICQMPDWVYLKVHKGRVDPFTVVPSSLNSADAWICEGIGGTVSLEVPADPDVMYYVYPGGFLYINLNAIVDNANLDKDEHKLCIKGVYGYYEKNESFALNGGEMYLGDLNLVYCELIGLDYFTAADKNGNVLLEWKTSTEIDNMGFNIFRSESKAGLFDNPDNMINPDLILSQAPDGSGAVYKYVDWFVECGKTYYYGLQDIDKEGNPTNHIDFIVEFTPDCG